MTWTELDARNLFKVQNFNKSIETKILMKY